MATEDTEVEAQPNPSPSDSLPITTFDRNSVRVPWGGCVDPRYPGSDKIEIGKRTVVCFHIGNSINWAGGVEYIRVSFAPVADQYSRLHIPNCKYSLLQSCCGGMEFLLICCVQVLSTDASRCVVCRLSLRLVLFIYF